LSLIKIASPFKKINKMKTNDNWKNELINSVEEKDIMQLRNKLHEIQILTENQLQSYSMNSNDEEDFV
jgi:hypothetical protein